VIVSDIIYKVVDVIVDYCYIVASLHFFSREVSSRAVAEVSLFYIALRTYILALVLPPLLIFNVFG